MKVPVSWLKEFVYIGDTSPHSLASLLTMAGLEVEELVEYGANISNVFTSKITSISKHPNAEKLSLCEVTDGKKLYQVVCGASNISAGDIVPLALEGTVLPNGIVIKKAAIRGIESEGMLCSKAELGLEKESHGIYILPHDTPLGIDLKELVYDVVMNISVTPNRGDCLSVLGVAREVAVLLGKPLMLPDISLNESFLKTDDLINISIIDSKACPRYTARIVKGVEVKQSPDWLKERIEKAGLRSINNIVDVTNYLMLELGQPLHTFDMKMIKGDKIVVKFAMENEEFTTLDGMKRVLKNEDLLICDAERGVAIAGVMGGENSEVTEDTTDILIESANFNPYCIRKTAKRLALPSDASYRFERGVDPNFTDFVCTKAAKLIQMLAGGEITRGITDCYPVKINPATVSLRILRLNKILGTYLKIEQVRSFFTALGFTIISEKDGVVDVSIPTFRSDITREIDLIEEAARVDGYQNIPVNDVTSVMSGEVKTIKNRLIKEVKEFLINNGFNEQINYSFISPSDIIKLSGEVPDKENYLFLANPISEEQSVMRKSLVNGAVSALIRNFNYKNVNLNLFEIGKVFLPGSSNELPDERNNLLLLMTGSLHEGVWDSDKRYSDFYDLKGILENLFKCLKIKNIFFEPNAKKPFIHPGISAKIVIEGKNIGWLGRLNPLISEKLEISSEVYICEIDLYSLIEAEKIDPVYVPLPKFPSVVRDIALLIDENVLVEDIKKIILSADCKKVIDLKLFDVYKGDNIPEGKKSIAFRITYQDFEKTLTDSEVDDLQKIVIEHLQKNIQIDIRV